MVFRYTIKCALLAILLACTFRSYGQNLENAHWHFGQEIGLFHTSTSLELTSSSINTLNGVTPASISNSSGQLQLYTNGTDVHNASHEIIENGSFSNTGLMNVFVPMPGNPDQYYIFRSAEWGVDYSIIDLTLNGGNGGVIEDQKEIEINAYKSELMVSGNPLTENLWLIIADNQAGNTDNINFRSFEVSSSAVTLMETSSFNYLWAGFFSDLDNARLSPDCSKI